LQGCGFRLFSESGSAFEWKARSGFRCFRGSKWNHRGRGHKRGRSEGSNVDQFVDDSPSFDKEKDLYPKIRIFYEKSWTDSALQWKKRSGSALQSCYPVLRKLTN